LLLLSMHAGQATTGHDSSKKHHHAFQITIFVL